MKLFLSMLTIAGAMTACTREPSGPVEAGHVVASVQESAATPITYEGSGRFSVGSHPRAPFRPTFFILRSAAADGSQGLILMRPGSEMPVTGRHVLGPDTEFSARYERRSGSVREGYTAREGELEIVSATPDRLEGTFRFTAVRNCTSTGSATHCILPTAADGPTIDVAGSFVAVRVGAGSLAP